MRLINDGQKIFGEVGEERIGRLPRLPTVEMPRIILNAVTVAEFTYHRDILPRSPFQALRFEYFSGGIQDLQTLLQFYFYIGDRGFRNSFGGRRLPGGKEAGGGG